MAPIVTRRSERIRRLSGAELGTDIDRNDTRTGTPRDRLDGNGPGSTGGRSQRWLSVARYCTVYAGHVVPCYQRFRTALDVRGPGTVHRHLPSQSSVFSAVFVALLCWRCCTHVRRYGKHEFLTCGPTQVCGPWRLASLHAIHFYRSSFTTFRSIVDRGSTKPRDVRSQPRRERP